MLYLILYKFEFFKDHKFNSIWNTNLLLKYFHPYAFLNVHLLLFKNWGEGREVHRIVEKVL